MAREEELKRIDLKVNVSCCDGCRRKVMKAMSLKGVLRTEMQPSHDRVTVVGDVDVKVLVKKLAKVGKIAEALPPASEQGKTKQRDDDGGRKDGDRAAPAQVQAEEKYKGKDDAGVKAAASKHEGCKKCAREAAARGAVGGNGDHGSGKQKARSSKDAAAAASGWSGEEGGDADAGGFDGKPLAVAVALDQHHAQAPQPQVQVQQQQLFYHRAEPAMVVPAYYPPPVAAAAVPYYGMPPPPLQMVPMAAAQRHHPPQVRPQPSSRFDEDFFDDDNTVGCSVM